MAAPRVFAARLAGLPLFDPLGDQVGRVRDVVAILAPVRARAVGLVVEVPGRRRVFLAMTRVTSLEAGQVITTGLVNMRRFQQRPTETLVVADLLDRRLTLADGSGDLVIEDVAMERTRAGDWVMTKVFGRRAVDQRRSLRRRGETVLVGLDAVTGLAPTDRYQGAANLLAAFDDLKPADLAEVLHAMTPTRRREVAQALTDDKLADVLEELPDDDQVDILTTLQGQRAADVLEAMEPDDAADLLSDLPLATAERLLERMEPGEAAAIRRLLAYDEDTAGGMMTIDPVILPPEAPVAEALAQVRREDLSPAVAAAVYVCRPPSEPPTGRFIGTVHVQRLLREPPQTAVGEIVDRHLQPLPDDALLPAVTRFLASYNLVSAPVVDPEGRLVGVVTVDDVLDHLLPDDWREEQGPEALSRRAARRAVDRTVGALATTTAGGLVRRRPAEEAGGEPGRSRGGAPTSGQIRQRERQQGRQHG
ncbi:MAG: magnesium transporter MgtE N-terminal domain-containing protein [Kineosporiaceae bacterium]